METGVVDAEVWLEENALGFRALAQDERKAISSFAFLWSLFEAKALKTQASPTAILQLVDSWSKDRRLDSLKYNESLEYFRHRYVAKDGTPTRYFDGLRLREQDRSLVNDVLGQQGNNNRDQVLVLLVIIYRFRNNLFHGTKWGYELSQQRENFLHANRILIELMTKLVDLNAD